MERADDFSSLLAALGRGSQQQVQPQVGPQQVQQIVPQPMPQMPIQYSQPYAWQPMPAGPFSSYYPPQIPQPQYAPPPPEAEPKKANPWVIAALIAAVVVCAGIAWMRIMRVKDKEEEEEEEEEKLEIPPPSSATVPEVEVEADIVATNLLKYVNDFGSKDIVDISGKDLPLESPPSPTPTQRHAPSKRLVADESQEVLDYAKKRDALFSTASPTGV